MNEAKQKAKELVEKFFPIVDYGQTEATNHAKQCALIACDNEYNGIIYVLGELKSRGELTDKIYLKCLNDLNNERQSVKQEITKL